MLEKDQCRGACCDRWARTKFCENNSTFMRSFCKTACAKEAERLAIRDEVFGGDVDRQSSSPRGTTIPPTNNRGGGRGWIVLRREPRRRRVDSPPTNRGAAAAAARISPPTNRGSASAAARISQTNRGDAAAETHAAVPRERVASTQ